MQQTERNTYSSDKEQAQNTARIQIEFCIVNIEFLRKVDRKKKMENSLISFSQMLKIKEPFTPNQLNYIDGIYEATMKGFNLPSIGLHIAKKKKGLRY
jgi:hypothetical protein